MGIQVAQKYALDCKRLCLSPFNMIGPDSSIHLPIFRRKDFGKPFDSLENV